MTDTILDALTATRDLVQMQHGPEAPATKVLDKAIVERKTEITAVRYLVSEAIAALNECREKYGCDTPVSATDAITSLMELQRIYRP